MTSNRLIRVLLSGFGYLVMVFFLIPEANAQANTAFRTELKRAVSSLKPYRPSKLAKKRVLDYAALSSSSTLLRGLRLLLDLEAVEKQELARKKAIIKRLRVDGKAADWQQSGLLIADGQNDTVVIDETLYAAAPQASDDLAYYSVVLNEKYIYALVAPFTAPLPGEFYHYRINLFNENGKMMYAIVWTSYGNFVQQWDLNTGEFITVLPVKKNAFASGQVFEAKIPLRIFPWLPYQFHIEAVVWHEERNLYDSAWDYANEQSITEKHKRASLELLYRYAEQTELQPDDPFPVVQAIVDGYLFKRADETTKPQIVADGLAMIQKGKALNTVLFSGQVPLAQMGLEQLLVWADRSLMYAGYGGLRYYVSGNERFNLPAYQFMVLNPGTLEHAVSFMAANNLIAQDDLSTTITNVNSYLWSKIKYRRTSFEAIEEMYQNSPDDPWTQNVYEESLYELQNGLTGITTVNGMTINKGAVFTPNFQIEYLASNGLFYGNCVDVAVMAAAFYKALGIPSLHFFYGDISENYYEERHSIVFYYSSNEQRWFNFERGAEALSLARNASREALQQAVFLNRPDLGASWQSRHTPILGSKIWRTTRNYYLILGADQWEDLYNNGIAGDTVLSLFYQPTN